MAKLSPDYIQFVLSLNTSQAQQEIHKLEKASNELKSENKDLRKSVKLWNRNDIPSFRNS